MTKNEKKLWSVVLAYGGLLIVSVFVDPNWGVEGVASNLTFWILGPTLGTFLLLVGTLALVAGRKISIQSGIAAVVFLVAVSLVCLSVTVPIMMTV